MASKALIFIYINKNSCLNSKGSNVIDPNPTDSLRMRYQFDVYAYSWVSIQQIIEHKFYLNYWTFTPTLNFVAGFIEKWVVSTVSMQLKRINNSCV